MNDQTYVYDGGLQGWDDTFTEDISTYVTVTGLKGSDGTGYDTLRSITVIGQKKNAGEYENASEPSAAVIGRNRATDDNLAANYAITYVKGKLIIKKKWDPSPGTGDSTRTLLWMSIMLMSAVGFGGVMWLSSRRKRRVEE